MDIVIDANILFAMLIKKGITERIFMSNDLHVYAPEYIFVEFNKHEKTLLKITKREKKDFENLIDVLERRIELIPISEFQTFIKEAESLLEDKDDAAYLAICISKEMPLWTNDNGFKKQDRVKVYTTQELITMLGVN
ncbi:MAG: PIN domain-containing protein [Candidatus Marsarchaeota archaeon]|nr:PIN domain-containing protein [Candidatus Marsarchaeota archaeon]